MIQHYFKIASRNILKYKIQNTVSIIGLSVGLLCFSFCMYCFRFIWNTDHNFTNYQHIVEFNLHDNQTEKLLWGTPGSLKEELSTWTMNEVEDITCVVHPWERSYNIDIKGKSLPYELVTMEVDSSYNKIFTPYLISGSWKTVVQIPNAVVLCQSTAIRLFGSTEDAIGKHLTLQRRLNTSPASTPRNGGIIYVIQAVMEDIPLNSSLHFMVPIDMLTLNDSEGLFQSSKRSQMAVASTYALLTSNTTCNQLEKYFSQHNYTCNLREQTYKVQATRIGSNLRKNVVFHLGLTTGLIGLLILLVGLINFYHFQIGSFLNRTKEYSIMKVIGCNRMQLFSLLFIQILIIISVSVLLVLWGIELLGNYLYFSIPRLLVVTFDSSLLLTHLLQYTAGLIAVSAVICALVAERIRRLSIQEGIRGSQKRMGKQWIRNGMLGIQFFICWIFVALTVALFLQSNKTSNTLFHTLSKKEKSEILSIPLNYDFMKNEEKLVMVELFRQHAGVKDVLLSDVRYMSGISGNRLMAEKGNEDSWIEVSIMSVPNNFFSFMNLPLIEGDLPKTKNEILADQTWQHTHKESVIETHLYDFVNDYTICGVCAPFQESMYHSGSPGFIFLPYDPSVYVGHCYIKCYPEQLEEVVKWIEKVQKETLPENISAQVDTLLDNIYEEHVFEYQLKKIILFFAIVTLIITLLGVYSSITLDTERRQKEVAIRKINGASLWQLITLFANLYSMLLISSAFIAFPLIHIVLMKWKQMYKVFFNAGIGFWLSIFMLVTLITTITLLFRILQTARMNPAEVIKNE